MLRRHGDRGGEEQENENKLYKKKRVKRRKKKREKPSGMYSLLSLRGYGSSTAFEPSIGGTTTTASVQLLS
jgi:hypothetical protein